MTLFASGRTPGVGRWKVAMNAGKSFPFPVNLICDFRTSCPLPLHINVTKDQLKHSV